MTDKKQDMENMDMDALDQEFEDHLGVDQSADADGQDGQDGGEGGGSKFYPRYTVGDNIYDENLEEHGVWEHLDEEKFGPDGPQVKVARITSDRFADANEAVLGFLTSRFGANYKDSDVPKPVKRYMSIRRAMAVLTDWKNIYLPDDAEPREFTARNIKAVLTSDDSTVLNLVLRTMLNDEKYLVPKEQETLAKN